VGLLLFKKKSVSGQHLKKIKRVIYRPVEVFGLAHDEIPACILCQLVSPSRNARRAIRGRSFNTVADLTLYPIAPDVMISMAISPSGYSTLHAVSWHLHYPGTKNISSNDETVKGN
jgi:hypothetical protein